MVTTRKRRSQTFVPIGNAKPDKRITAIPGPARRQGLRGPLKSVRF
jgi:hypothetical protein